MANFTVSDVHVDAALSQISVAWTGAAFDPESIFLGLPVDKESDKFFLFDRGDWHRDQAELRADGTAAKTGGFGVSTDSYKCQEYALRIALTDRVIKNADDGLKPATAITEAVTRGIIRNRSRAWAADFFKTGVWATDLTPTVKWDTHGTSNPVSEVLTAAEQIGTDTDISPEDLVLVLGPAVFKALVNHPDIVNGIKYVGKPAAGAEDMATAFKIGKVVIAKGIYSTSNEGATDATARIYGKNALLIYVPKSPGLLTPAAGYTFRTRARQIKRWRDEDIAGDWIEGSALDDQKLVSKFGGYFFNAAVA